METRYPIRKADGTEYQHYREIVNLLGNNDGQWLVANNFLWHGGIHINRNSAPLSVLEEGHPERAIPLQCMATGDVVALRVNERYKEAPYGDEQKIAYSSTFALVRSIHKPDPNKQSSWLTFYTLYMHLAALSDYPKSKLATIIEPTGLKLRRVTGHETEGQPASSNTDGTFAKGTHVEVGRSMSFKLNDVTRLFCVVRKLDSNGQPQGRPFWVVAGEDNLRTESEQYAYLPDWMQEAVRTSTFDSVIVPATPIPIAAGKSVGYLGRDDVPDERDNVKIDWQTHIEVFSNDSNMPRFLSNPENIQSREKGWIKAKAEAILYQRRDVENVTTFAPTDKKVSADDTWQVIEPEQTTPCEIEGKWWFRYQSEPDYWLSQDGVDEINPHNLIGRNFKPFEQPATGEVEKTLVEPWVSKALRWFGSTQKHDEGSLFPSPWEATAKTIDMYGDHAIENFMFKHLKGLILSRLHNISEGIPELRRRLIVKHESEWHGDSETPRWKKVLQECSDKERPWLTQWRDDVEWMSQVDGFKDDAQKMVWHFHPLEFLAGINNEESLIDTDAFVEEYKKMHSSFSVAGIFTGTSESNLRKLVDNINSYYSGDSEYKPNLYKLAYMFATARHETFLFNARPVEFFRSGPEVGNIRYFDKYDPVLASTEERRDYAKKQGNIHQGDGYKYRGRGLVHLTWCKNYERAGEKLGVDLVTNPDLAMDLKNSIPIMIWGMEEGVFTSVGINSYIYAGHIDYKNARRVINGLDEAQRIAVYAGKFQAILEKTSTAPKAFQ